MKEIKLKVFELGALYTNSYLIYSGDSKKGVLIDAPEGTEIVLEFIHRERITIEEVLLTHGHFDHIGGLEVFQECPFYIHSLDAAALKDSRRNGSAFFDHPIVIVRKPHLYDDDLSLSFENSSFKILHTPGHTPGSVSILYKKWLFSGDTIFLNSIGRTDFPLSSQEDILSSIENEIFTLPPDTVIYPGHGSSTTVEREKTSNPYLV
jgi:hydroxyacylglutathione hydrolase